MKKLVFTFLFTAVISLAAIWIWMRCGAAQMDGTVELEEEAWEADGLTRKESKYFHVLSPNAGDVVYDAYGYRITLISIDEKEAVFGQEGGLVRANEDGSLNAFAGAKESYRIKAGDELILRSYSLRSGVRIQIRIPAL